MNREPPAGQRKRVPAELRGVWTPLIPPRSPNTKNVHPASVGIYGRPRLLQIPPPGSPGGRIQPGWRRSRASAPAGGSDAVPSRDVQRAPFLGSVQESARGRRVFPPFVRGSLWRGALRGCRHRGNGAPLPPHTRTHTHTQGQNKWTLKRANLCCVCVCVRVCCGR